MVGFSALRVRHKRVSAAPDIPADAGLIQPSDWNEEHLIEGMGAPVQAGRWFDAETNGSGGVGVIAGQGAVVVGPLLVNAAFLVDRVALDVVQGAAGASVLLVLYRMAADGGPGQQLMAAQVAAEQAGTVEAEVSLSLAAGLYWLGAWVPDGLLLRAVAAVSCASLGRNAPGDLRPALSLVAAGVASAGEVAADYTGAGAFAHSTMTPPAVRLRAGV